MKCHFKKGFLTFMPCSELAIGSCSISGMPVCAKHSIQLPNGNLVAVDRISELPPEQRKELERDKPEATRQRSDSAWAYSNRRSWYDSHGYAPIYLGYYGLHHYDNYDVRGFDRADTPGAVDPIEGEEPIEAEDFGGDEGSLYDS